MSQRSASESGVVRLLLLLAWIGCASPLAAPAPGRSAVVGSLRLVPHAGVTPHHGEGAYGDRRLRDVRFVDYSKPGFGVVFVEASTPPAGSETVVIRSTRLGTVVEPEYAAIGAAGALRIENRSGDDHVVSYPAAGRVERLAPGDALTLAVARPGEQALFLLDAPQTKLTLFGAPGPFAVTSSSGRFHLDDLPPGETRLHVWHPRFPPTTRRVRLEAGVRQEVDLEIGVGLDEDAPHAR